MEIDEAETEEKSTNNDSNSNRNLTELEYFQLLYSKEIIDLLVEESNKYYSELLIEKYGSDYKQIIKSKEATSSYAYLFVTKGITKEDILGYIGIRIYMGIHNLPSIRHFWNGKKLYQTKISKLMNLNYFCLVGKALHFPEKEKNDENESSIENEIITTDKTIKKIDPRHKIKLYLESLTKNFQKYYELGRNITIDESLLHFKGKSSMKFYIPMKPYKYGFKIHLLCDADTHYLYNMLLDPGRSGKDFLYYEDNSSLAESIVFRLLSCINDRKQRNLF